MSTPAAPAADPMSVLQKLRIVVRSAQQHSAWIEKQCGVSGAQLWLIQELEGGPLRVGDLARRLAIHQSTTSNLIEALLRRGLVSKARDPEDQRAVRVDLTAAGRAVLERAPRPARGLLPSALGQMHPDALAALDASLQALLNQLGARDEELALLPLPFTM